MPLPSPEHGSNPQPLTSLIFHCLP